MLINHYWPQTGGDGGISAWENCELLAVNIYTCGNIKQLKIPEQHSDKDQSVSPARKIGRGRGGS